MDKLPSQSGNATETLLKDDLKQIEGIGPAIEKHLNENNIHTFSQLSRLKLDQLVDMLSSIPGHSRDRLIEKDWIAKARKLAIETGEQINEDSPSPAERPDRQHYVSFMIQLSLEPDKGVANTRITKIPEEQGAKDSWQGWDVVKLQRFIASFAYIDSDAEFQQSAETGKLTDIDTQKITPTESGEHQPSKAIEFKDLSLHVAHNPAKTWSIRTQDEPSLHVELDLEKASINGDPQVNYSLKYYMHRIGADENIEAGSLGGTAQLSSLQTMHARMGRLPPGDYRPIVTGIFTVLDEKGAPQLKFKSFRDGDIFKVV